MSHRVINSLPIEWENSDELDYEHLYLNCHAIIALNVLPRYHALTERNLVVFSGEFFVDSMSLLAPIKWIRNGIDWRLFRKENENELRYLAMYYDHTISLFRRGLMDLIVKINDIGETKGEKIEILFYCQPHQFQKFMMYDVMIQMYLEFVMQIELKYVSFMGCLSSAQKNLTELSSGLYGKYRIDIKEYDKIVIVDSNLENFNVSSISNINFGNTVNIECPTRFEWDMQSMIDSRSWIEQTDTIRHLLSADNVLFDLQPKIEFDLV